MDPRFALTQALDTHRADILAFSQDLIRIASENPPGNHYCECADRIRAELERLGLAYQVVEVPGFLERPRYNLLSFHGNGQRTLYFHGHYDVVPAQSREQFTPRVEKGRLYGRGAADMKAAVASMIYAAFLIKKCRIPLQGRVGLCIVADEETGGKGGSGYLDEIGLLGKDGFAMVTPEPTGGVIWNANRGAITLRITVKGKFAHVGLQHEGINAFEQMLEVARALMTDPEMLLLDEPTAGATFEETRKLMSYIEDLRKDHGLTFLIVEHKMEVIMNLCDRIFVMNNGRKLTEGTPREVQRNPQVIEAYLGA